jgi:polyphenol oxidase
MHECFAELSAFPQFPHRFILREPGLAMDCDRYEALERLQQPHEAEIADMGFTADQFWTAEQVHGAEVAVVGGRPASCVAGADGLITNLPGILLGIYVADCCPVFLIDPVQQAIGLLHSGKKGTEGNITGNALSLLAATYGSRPEDVRVHLGPCIRPPRYEVDIPALIRHSALAAGVLPAHFTDSQTCTGSNLDKYYSYRMEKGRTGRLLALLAKKNPG